ncbi:hypothetical protein F7725_009606, partial [Dissostichus mawsoni]
VTKKQSYPEAVEEERLPLRVDFPQNIHNRPFLYREGTLVIPSLARKVGHSLHSLAMFLKSEGLKSNDKESAKDAEEFAQLYRESWKCNIASQALTQLEQSKWNSPQLLQFTKDVQNLHSHLSEKQLECLKDLKEVVSQSNWKDLAKVTLAQVILFNRRREGEVSRMPVSADVSEMHEDVNLALTTLEQKLCKHFVRITIVGKRGRKVPVLLTPLMRESLDTLIKKREEHYRLPEGTLQLAKISKVLLALEQGE